MRIFKKNIYIVCYRISVQCLSKFTLNRYKYKIYLLGSSCSATVTLTETTSDTICTSGMTADATSRSEK